MFLSPLQAWKENQKLRNFNIAPIHNSRLSDWLIVLHLRSVVVEWARSGPWDAELKYFHVPLKMTSPDHLVWHWHHDEPALYILCKVNANSNKLLEKFEPHSSFWFQYRLLTMTTLFEIAVKTLSWMRHFYTLSLSLKIIAPIGFEQDASNEAFPYRIKHLCFVFAQYLFNIFGYLFNIFIAFREICFVFCLYRLYAKLLLPNQAFHFVFTFHPNNSPARNYGPFNFKSRNSTSLAARIVCRSF